jgi:lipopolysaccharide transport system ATP-binding protein
MENKIQTTTAIQASSLGKCYQIYEQPIDRLKQAVFRGRRKYYREFWALRDVNFCMNVGETLGIIGRNGSGKSTLLQMICGTLTPTEGTVHTQGRVAALLELGSGFNPEFTGIENVHLNASLLGLSQAEIEAKLDDILSFADIGDFVNQPVKTYSSGMVVRLAFGVIANSNPSILVVDEALAVGDAVFTRKCMRFIDSLRQERTILFVSHDAASVASLCDQCLWLDKGHVIMQSDTRRVLESYRKACHAEFQSTDLSIYDTQLDLQDSSSIFSSPPAKPTSSPDAPHQSLHPSLRTQNHSFATGLPLVLKDKVVEASHSAQQFGDGAVLIEQFSLVYKDRPDQAIDIVKGGEILVLTLHARCRQEIFQPCIAGFGVSNEKGLEFFGENTFIAEDPLAGPCLQPGEWLTAEFCFTMPPLRPGQYFVVVALASGTQSDHVQHHYIHEAIQFVSVANLERPIMGMFATDIHAVRMRKWIDSCPSHTLNPG